MKLKISMILVSCRFSFSHQKEQIIPLNISLLPVVNASNISSFLQKKLSPGPLLGLCSLL